MNDATSGTSVPRPCLNRTVGAMGFGLGEVRTATRGLPASRACFQNPSASMRAMTRYTTRMSRRTTARMPNPTIVKAHPRPESASPQPLIDDSGGTSPSAGRADGRDSGGYQRPSLASHHPGPIDCSLIHVLPEISLAEPSSQHLTTFRPTHCSACSSRAVAQWLPGPVML